MASGSTATAYTRGAMMSHSTERRTVVGRRRVRRAGAVGVVVGPPPPAVNVKHDRRVLLRRLRAQAVGRCGTKLRQRMRTHLGGALRHIGAPRTEGRHLLRRVARGRTMPGIRRAAVERQRVMAAPRCPIRRRQWTGGVAARWPVVRPLPHTTDGAHLARRCTEQRVHGCMSTVPGVLPVQSVWRLGHAIGQAAAKLQLVPVAAAPRDGTSPAWWPHASHVRIQWMAEVQQLIIIILVLSRGTVHCCRFGRRRRYLCLRRWRWQRRRDCPAQSTTPTTPTAATVAGNGRRRAAPSSSSTRWRQWQRRHACSARPVRWAAPTDRKSVV